ncbi:GNAT family N-acetyltransferase [Streptomyces canus]|uniref:GNAT family N-acetyltransferase n=1 Tax=Streptomyces canus TaxID=58343 RepID=UPI0027807C49|nr:GNAT family N-acetyltransferase [Streptomyces canus]MDQ0765000.1 ribosomal protein S18 acetylase RimI-like enzyme [Streptomyces canus]MDQ1066566.1 ribosomal protein S18 acetylase RimI-like enzyme [Streptomyces canus]
MKIRVRDAHPADVEWMSNNTEGWTVTVEKQEGAASLAEALHALIAEDSDQGVRMGWLHSSLQRAAGGEPRYVRLYELHVSPEFRQRGVARALVDELFARVPDQEIILSAWDRELYGVWLKLGFTYVPEPDEMSGDCSYPGDMVRPPVEASS